MSRQKYNSMIGKCYDLISQLRELEDVEHAYLSYWNENTCVTKLNIHLVLQRLFLQNQNLAVSVKCIKFYCHSKYTV